jgi:hypothetical protein
MSNKSVESYKLGRADASPFEPHARRSPSALHGTRRRTNMSDSGKTCRFRMTHVQHKGQQYDVFRIVGW